MKKIILAAMLLASSGVVFAEGETNASDSAVEALPKGGADAKDNTVEAEPKGDVDARDSAVEAMPKGDASNGEKLANKGYCYTCHGDKGQPLTQNAPNLAGFSSEWIYTTLVNYKYGLFNIDNKSKVMEAVVQPMTNQDMSDLATYYSGFKRVAGAGAVAKPEKVKKCNRCHEDDDEGVPLLGGQSALYLERQLLAYQSKTRHTEDGNSMFKKTRKLKPDQIKELAKYYADQ